LHRILRTERSAARTPARFAEPSAKRTTAARLVRVDDARQGLELAMAAAGLAPTKRLTPVDGALVRYRVEDDKPGSANGWVVFHEGPTPWAAFGSWRTGQSLTWRASTGHPETAADKAMRLQQLAHAQRLRAAELAQVQMSARTRAERLWRLARPATNAHPYLKAKGVPAYGIRLLGSRLLVPLRDVNGALHSLQFISPAGEKRFLTGGLTKACYFGIGKPERELLLGEGLATCSTLHQATGSAVAVCFSCGNLEPVARALRGKFPQLRIVVCADDDSATPGNPGITAATAAARAIGGFLALPRPEGSPA
jgi:putative DNA primase/helicase